jgi:hypothetical protein
MTAKTDEASPKIPVGMDTVISEAEIDEALIETFPASDPPQWTLGTDHLIRQSSKSRKPHTRHGTRKLDKSRWQGFFDRVSKGLVGKNAEIEVASLDLGAQVEAKWLPLLGVTYEPKADLIAIALENVDHMVRKPREVFIDDGPLGLSSFEAVDNEGRQHIVQLRDPLLLPPP